MDSPNGRNLVRSCLHWLQDNSFVPKVHADGLSATVQVPDSQPLREVVLRIDPTELSANYVRLVKIGRGLQLGQSDEEAAWDLLQVELKTCVDLMGEDVTELELRGTRILPTGTSEEDPYDEGPLPEPSSDTAEFRWLPDEPVR